MSSGHPNENIFLIKERSIFPYFSPKVVEECDPLDSQKNNGELTPKGSELK